ncbi:5'-3' exonuclease [Luteimicrobium xylanilyticum]|uniref:5'-3' exonuclease n=1 Tax=Luteimicrobium xylanilyticum TaxID=1133546 RepID=A0A5P9QEK3_9MICO|nr:5'-3' exonuclease [Luteimicrobium xylanilyticum]QFU99894.1 DNA-directed DNA polymerase [Luteimicrobium xylanilyticum]
MSSQPSGRLLLLDTASLYFRAFFGVPDSLRAPDGTPVNAVRGLLDMIATLVTDHRPTRLVACWDEDWRPEFRVAAIPSYKAHRVASEVAPEDVGPGDAHWVEEVPPTLVAQVPVIVEVLAALGIARVGAPGFEADDVIGTLTAREVARPAGERDSVDVVTGDRDLFQLVDDDAGVRILYPVKGIKNLLTVDQAVLREKYAVPTGAAYADMAILRGDPSDGLPGVAGIGEKTAAALIERYGTLDGILAARDSTDPGLTATQRRRLTEASDYLDVAPGVVRVVRSAPVVLPAPSATRPVPDDVPAAPVDPDALAALVERWGLASSVRRVTDAFAQHAVS